MPLPCLSSCLPRALTGGCFNNIYVVSRKEEPGLDATARNEALIIPKLHQLSVSYPSCYELTEGLQVVTVDNTGKDGL
jgi:hypothetical protein